MGLSREERLKRKAQANREYRARKAREAGREPGRTGRPPTGRKAPKCHGNRPAQNERRKLKRLRQRAEHGSLAESSLIRKAREIASAKRKADRRAVLWDDTFEDLVGEVVLALCEGTDPGERMHQFLKDRWYWHRWRAPLYEEW